MQDWSFCCSIYQQNKSINEQKQTCLSIKVVVQSMVLLIFEGRKKNISVILNAGETLDYVEALLNLL